MSKLESQGGSVRVLCRSLVHIHDQRVLIKFFLAPFVISFPTFLAWLVTRPDVFAGSAFISSVTTWMSNHMLLSASVALLAPALVHALGVLIRTLAKPAREISRDDIHAILMSIDKVVEAKLHRFSEALQHAENYRTQPRPNIFFLTITRPDLQLRHLIEAAQLSLSSFFGEDIKVTLLELSKGRPIRWIAYAPLENPPKSQPEDLCVPTSTVMHAIRKRDIEIVENTAKELSRRSKSDRKYIAGMSDRDDTKSILCYPFALNGFAPDPDLVLSLVAPNADTFQNLHKGLYRSLLDRFVLRVRLEFCLKRLRGFYEA